jgi:DNA polymerase-3 subunit epsilon
MLKKSSKDQWLPLHLDKREIDKLPAKPGVYYFHNSKDKIVYVGKAINLKKRVSSHFTLNDPDRKRQQFLRTIYKLTYRQCATELEAIVFESTEIKRLWPKYNNSQKQPSQKFGLYLFEDGRGYLRLAIDKKKKHLQPLYSFNLLHEGQVMLKKMIEEFELDAKLCFIDKTPFGIADLEFLEMPAIYNGKVKKALEALDERLPTFVLLDDGIKDDERLCLLIERGSFWGMGYLPKDFNLTNAKELKNHLEPYSDNDYIRNSIYNFAILNPEKKIELK